MYVNPCRRDIFIVVEVKAFGPQFIPRFSCFWQSYDKVSPIAIYYRNFLNSLP